jgi:AcrR family transcriptional regulator
MVELILQAATRVLQRESLAGFNTNRVAAVAGISVGSLYQYFPNKDALMAALVDRAQNALVEAVETRIAQLASSSLAGALRALAELAVAQQYADPLLAAALDHEEKRLPLHDRLMQARQRIVAAVEQLLARHRRQLAPDLPASAARDCLVLTQALAEADAGRTQAPAPDLADHIVRALYGYLTVRLPRRSE